MSIYVGNQKIREIRLGSQKIREVFYGSQKVFPSEDTRGWWIHKDTNAKTYFDTTSSFIANGIMSRPGWIANAKEIRLCAGITDFAKIPASTFFGGGYSPRTHSVSSVFYVDDNGTPAPLQKIDFGSASAATAYCMMFSMLNQLTDVVLNSSVTKIEPAFFSDMANNTLKRVTIPASVSSIENGSVSGSTLRVFGNQDLNTIYTDAGNATRLAGLLQGKGLPADYQIIEI